MTSSANRAALLVKAHKVLKKHYKPHVAPSDRSVLECLLYACCLDNAQYEAADEAFALLQESFYDWNEVRVTTVTELVESLRPLPDPLTAATNLKSILQNVFETQYSFDIDALRKQNLGKSVKEIEKYAPASPFVVAYATQNALGGHAIPIGQGSLTALHAIGAAGDVEVQRNRVPGVERAIPKNKGVEFASLLHQLGADCYASMFASRVRSILLEIAPDAKERFPKRQSRVKASAQETKAPSAKKKSAPAKNSAPIAKTGAKRATTKKLTKKKPK